MSRIAFTGNPLGTGTVTIASPNTNADRTVTLPDQNGTLFLNSTNGALNVDASAPANSLVISSTGAITGSSTIKSNSGGFVFPDNTTQTTAASSAFPAGTVMLFGQTSAPTGWTKDTTNFNNSALRVVTGSASTGGSVDFTTAFASQTPAGTVSVNTSGLSAGATTLSTSQIPSHTHTVPLACGGGGTGAVQSGTGATLNTGAAGGGGSHTHSVSGSATATFSGTAINLAVKYVDVIRATKD